MRHLRRRMRPGRLYRRSPKPATSAAPRPARSLSCTARTTGSNSLNFLHRGAPKYWIVCGAARSHAPQAVPAPASLTPCGAPRRCSRPPCSQFVRHLAMWRLQAGAATLGHRTYDVVEQRPGERADSDGAGRVSHRPERAAPTSLKPVNYGYGRQCRARCDVLSMQRLALSRAPEAAAGRASVAA